MPKPVRVIFLDDTLERTYLALSSDDYLKKRIAWVIQRLKEHPSFGQPIAKRLIPNEYKQRGISNAFWVDLSSARGWRLIYSLTSETQEETLAIIVEWFTRHKDYERRFGYR